VPYPAGAKNDDFKDLRDLGGAIEFREHPRRPGGVPLVNLVGLCCLVILADESTHDCSSPYSGVDEVGGRRHGLGVGVAADVGCTQSTLALASQARKYGLGLVFATQAPKGLHNRISGNATTQLFGLLNSPVQITAAREMAAAKGGDVSDISLLKAGQFYAAVEGRGFTKIRTPLCLSYHPRAPLATEEVIALARGN
jgi:hypothetical protein